MNHYKEQIFQANQFFNQVLEGKATFQPAALSYKKLRKKNSQFSMGPGMTLSQTMYNTAPTIYEPTYMQSLLHHIAVTKKKTLEWLKQQRWYTLTCLPQIICNNPICGKTLNFQNVSDLTTEQQNILLKNIADNLSIVEDPKLTATICPYCESTNISNKPQLYKQFSKKYQDAMVKQVEGLNVFNQQKKKFDYPACRMSIELAEILQDGTDQIDYKKLQQLAEFIKDLRNPLLFIHHYTNSQVKPHIFEHEDDIDWFANICAEIVKACPHVTHVCPISQPMGFARKASRNMQPPFSISVGFNKYFNNIVKAQTHAAIKMKQVRPNLQVLLSHQWKPMKPKHTSFGFTNLIERLASKIADMIYNQKLVSSFTPYNKYFDGIALSIYPAIYIDGFKVVGDNCTGKLDPHAALQAIVDTSHAFPDKDIYIVETGCNCPNQSQRKTFIDMTLQICQIAQEMNVPVKTCFFWTLTNDLYFYREWNSPPGSTHFGFYDELDANDPTDSINASGQYLKEILKSV